MMTTSAVISLHNFSMTAIYVQLATLMSLIPQVMEATLDLALLGKTYGSVPPISDNLVM